MAYSVNKSVSYAGLVWRVRFAGCRLGAKRMGKIRRLVSSVRFHWLQTEGAGTSMYVGSVRKKRSRSGSKGTPSGECGNSQRRIRVSLIGGLGRAGPVVQKPKAPRSGKDGGKPGPAGENGAGGEVWLCAPKWVFNARSGLLGASGAYPLPRYHCAPACFFQTLGLARLLSKTLTTRACD